MTEYVGIILVSHSEKIAEGTKDLIREVITDVPIEVAGGEDSGNLGTSLEKIQHAIEKIKDQTKRGILIFYDLGSAKMNSELALELSGEANVKIVEAPLVEGSYVAAVEAQAKKSLEEISIVVEREFS